MAEHTRATPRRGCRHQQTSARAGSSLIVTTAHNLQRGHGAGRLSEKSDGVAGPGWSYIRHVADQNAIKHSERFRSVHTERFLFGFNCGRVFAAAAGWQRGSAGEGKGTAPQTVPQNVGPGQTVTAKESTMIGETSGRNPAGCESEGRMSLSAVAGRRRLSVCPSGGLCGAPDRVGRSLAYESLQAPPARPFVPERPHQNRDPGAVTPRCRSRGTQRGQ